MELQEKATYLTNLVKELDIDDSTKEGKLLLALVEVVSELTDNIGEIVEVIEEIDEDLEAVVEFLQDDEDGDEIPEDDMYEITCPKCEKTLTTDFDAIASGKLICPNCGVDLELELPDDEDGCGCGCGCGCDHDDEDGHHHHD